MVAVFDRDRLSETLESSYAGVTAVVALLEDTGFLIPTRCRGLLLADLLVHLALRRPARRHGVRHSSAVPC
jgi:hypothetical protein